MDNTRAAVSRRGFLSAIGAVGVGTLGGCTGVTGTESGAVSLLCAGSLARTVERHVGPAFREQTGRAIHGEYHGSNAVMRMVKEGVKRPDAVVSADATLLRDRLYGAATDWDVTFAANSLGLCYNEATEPGEQLAAGTPWYEVVDDADDGAISIGDPELDPLGYRALQAFELAQRAHDLDGFRDRVVPRLYTEPDEPQLLAGVETGSRAGAVVYKNMAADRGLPFVAFPDRYNFSNPALADHYATVSYTTDDGYTATGRPILYSATVCDDADDPAGGRALVRFLCANPSVLRAAGLRVSEQLPGEHGSVPSEVTV
ncbi:extracellular solute-binding protein [Halomicrobium sp. HM KBTZ05]|uniref:extracellular solute-binding protein n=1 Tax=Halomicrobium sp. HM KBTZ05 TaxID=3242663 RepID=UPI0035581175